MKYASPNNEAVITVNPKNGSETRVYRGHRFWTQWGIDQAEERGEIEAADPVEPMEAT